MAALLDTRRYLTDFDSRRISHVLTDVLVIGSGVAGARAAIEAAQHGDVILMCKQVFEESATRYAQGGIAAAIDEVTDVQTHFDDTMRVGAMLNDPQAVQLLVREGPARIRELIDWGLAFDRTGATGSSRATPGDIAGSNRAMSGDDQLARTREGGHSVHRIVHAGGDQTGLELVRTLHRRVHESARIRVFENCFLIDLLTIEGECHRAAPGLNRLCRGAVTFHPRHGHQLIWAAQTVLASGGCGQLWRETTNPSGATGDGFAAAFRAGAVLKDMELMQFHPTTLYVAGAGRALISEAVRGEGAYLVDKAGERFMLKYHPDGELAPRDIVSRVIHEHLTETRSNSVFLDVRHLKGFAKRFPYIAELCADFKIDVATDLIPVRPSAHYMIGGVAVELDGSSSVPGLLACGEVSCTGVHGANRMASNSLLEGLVFGRIAGQTAGVRAAAARDPNGYSKSQTSVHADSPDQNRDRQGAVSSGAIPTGDGGFTHTFAGTAGLSRAMPGVVSVNPPSSRTQLDLSDIRNSLASVMWRNVGIVRWDERLRETCEILDFWGHYTLDKTFDDPTGWEIQNKLMLARIITACALERTESLGVHFRRDPIESRDSVRTAARDPSRDRKGAIADADPRTSSRSSSPHYHITIQRGRDEATPRRNPC